MSQTPRLLRPLRTFLATETSGAILLVAAAGTALVWANSPWQGGYDTLWSTTVGFSVGDGRFELDLHHWVNDGLMTLFFLVVGLEIKRELVQGELADRRRAALPVAAAIGGVLVPALIFAVLTAGDPAARGWAIPVATDIAMALGVLKLAGRGRVPDSLTVFLLALAIVDDLVTILILIVFYSEGVEPVWLAAALVALVAMAAMKKLGIEGVWGYIAMGGLLWFALHEAHVHATLAGVYAGLLAPTTPALGGDQVSEDELLNLSDARAVTTTTRIARRSISVVERLEYRLHPWTSFAVLPLFALANAGIRFESELLDGFASSPLLHGVVLGSVLGKPLGISLGVWLALRSGVAAMPRGVSWPQLASVGALGGIGFTVAVYIANSSFDDELVIGQAKLAILVAAVVAALAGSAAVRRTNPRDVGS